MLCSVRVYPFPIAVNRRCAQLVMRAAECNCCWPGARTQNRAFALTALPHTCSLVNTSCIGQRHIHINYEWHDPTGSPRRFFFIYVQGARSCAGCIIQEVIVQVRAVIRELRFRQHVCVEAIFPRVSFLIL